MACDLCSAPCQGRHCKHCELARSHEGEDVEAMGWTRAKEIEGEEGNDR